MDLPNLPFSLVVSLIAATASNIVQLIVFIVLYKTLKAVKIQNANHEKNFVSQMNIEKNSITFRFADWVASEVKYYSPLYKKNKEKEYVLPPEKINTHLIAIGKKIVTMSKNNIIDIDVMKDEIERLILTLDNMESEPTHVISDLKKLL